MATADILLPLLGATNDESNPPGIGFINSRVKRLFDDTTPESLYWEFRMPDNYGSGLTAYVQYSMATATSNDVEWEVSIMAVSDGDSQDLDTDSYDSVNSGSATVPGTAGYLDEITITLTNDDSVAAGDYVAVKLSRDADDGTNDTASGDAELRAFSLVYTTS